MVYIGGSYLVMMAWIQWMAWCSVAHERIFGAWTYPEVYLTLDIILCIYSNKYPICIKSLTCSLLRGIDSILQKVLPQMIIGDMDYEKFCG
jgi:hypothetical protein